MTNGNGQPLWLATIAKPLLGHLPSLNPLQEWDAALDARIDALLLDSLTGGKLEQEPYGWALKAGLHLWNESLDRSHTISQEITNATGSYWHALMHRMEGDYSNAKYWFQDVGHHPIFTRLIHCVQGHLSVQDLSDMDNDALCSKLEVLITSPEWNPFVFIDAVELQVTHVQQQRTDDWLRHFQRYEMKLLLEYCYEQSCGGSLVEAIGDE